MAKQTKYDTKTNMTQQTKYRQWHPKLKLQRKKIWWIKVNKTIIKLL